MPDSSAPQLRSTRRFLLAVLPGLLVFGMLWVFYSTPALYGPRHFRELLVWPVTGLLLFSYWQGYRVMVFEAVSWRLLVGIGVLLALMAALVPPFHSTDLFGYINRGWQQLHYGLNPYVFTIDHILGWEQDPMITDHWVNNPSPYGFLYLWIAKGLCALGQGVKAPTVLAFKWGNWVLHLATAGVLWLAIRSLPPQDSAGSSGERSLKISLYLYLYNPLVLVHSLANGHNDLFMGFFITLAGYAALIGAWLWLLPALMAATLIKYGALVIVPLAILLLLRQKAWTALGGGLLLSALIFALTGWPYLADWQHFHLKEIGRNALVSHGSLHSLIYSLYKTLGKEVFPALYTQRELFRDWLKNALIAGFLGFYGWLSFQRWRQPRYLASQWLQDALLIMVLLVCVVSLKFYPWYLGMFFPLALLLPEGHWLRRFVLVLSGAQLLSITFIGQAHLLNFLLMTALPLGWLLWRIREKRAHPERSV